MGCYSILRLGPVFLSVALPFDLTRAGRPLGEFGKGVFSWCGPIDVILIEVLANSDELD